jgi:hypothetical protein
VQFMSDPQWARWFHFGRVPSSGIGGQQRGYHASIQGSLVSHKEARYGAVGGIKCIPSIPDVSLLLLAQKQHQGALQQQRVRVAARTGPHMMSAERRSIDWSSGSWEPNWRSFTTGTSEGTRLDQMAYTQTMTQSTTNNATHMLVIVLFPCSHVPRELVITGTSSKVWQAMITGQHFQSEGPPELWYLWSAHENQWERQSGNIIGWHFSLPRYHLSLCLIEHESKSGDSQTRLLASLAPRCAHEHPASPLSSKANQMTRRSLSWNL